MASEITTVEQATELAKQSSPLPVLAGQALKVLVAEIERLESIIVELGTLRR